MVFFTLCILLLIPFGLVILAGVIEWKHRAANGIVRPDYYGLEEDRTDEAMRKLQLIAIKRDEARRLMDSDRDLAVRLMEEADREEQQVREHISPN